MGRAEVELTLAEHRAIEREPPHPIELAVPLAKGDRQRWLVEKAVELGVTRLIPLTTARSQRSAAEAPAKLSRYVVEASKQCGRNRLLEVAPPRSWEELLAEGGAGVLAHPGGSPLGEVSAEGPVRLAIGPEGGFTDEEVATATAAGWQVVGLGERILRMETAAIALVARWAVR